ncbi:hypothetical protein K474DRAFT_1709748 [Panus rudis PR-1116 ss-1]|nr:hypothetical protein K474DRAFT_1709748 [Panus rudis PR-1116 ss-1]
MTAPELLALAQAAQQLNCPGDQPLEDLAEMLRGHQLGNPMTGNYPQALKPRIPEEVEEQRGLKLIWYLVVAMVGGQVVGWFLGIL